MKAHINGIEVTVLDFMLNEYGRTICLCRVPFTDRPLLFFADIIEVANA